MNILFIGQVVPEKKISECTGYSVAGDMMQKNIIRELLHKDKIEMTVISVLPNAAFPKDKLWIQGELDVHKEICIKNVSYINILGVKQVSQEKGIYREAMRKNNIQKFDLIICYNMYPQFGNAAIKLSKKLGIPLVAILADLPLESAKSYRGIKKLLFIPLKKNTLNNISKVNHGIILNENTKHYMQKNADYIVVPGGIENQKDSLDMQVDVNLQEKKIIYAGALSEYSGIINLIDAVKLLKIPDVTLEIYGSGMLKERIEEIEKKELRVKYKGVKSLDEMRKIMKNAWILINPRSVEDPISSVTFPSKIFEYIMCRRPVITTEFDGIPEEIKKITIGCGKGTPEEISKAINRVYEMQQTELDEFVEQAYAYVMDNVSWVKQGDRIYQYICYVGGNK